ncbi:Uncharacterised protein [Neisseria zoodegmatis]|uniref:Restriction endonuclease type IV Mrr domain-containing protein n=1 Tax=Neisseria zoodegmatis TaxID=326523 RepID=A0A378WEY4_9NEIS|nr:restriction endonuclease [Neisseria zoodegmatis]SUA35980.1 Uncharacterised protein [Neisseria zoodegmatis]
MNDITGKKYENFVAEIQKALFELDSNNQINNIEIELNKKIIDRNGIEREFDIYWEFEYGGYKYKTVIEYKDYSSPISIEKIDALIGKTNDISDLKLIFATKTGYQSGAAKKAERHNIKLLIVKEFDEIDWSASDGIREIILSITAITTPTIVEFTSLVDANWIEEQRLSEEWVNEELQLISFSLNNEIFINDVVLNLRYSLYELQSQLLKKYPDIKYGKGYYSEKLDNAFLENQDGTHKIKILGYELIYEYHEPITTKSSIRENILGLVEDFHTKERKFVSAGIIKENL